MRKAWLVAAVGALALTVMFGFALLNHPAPVEPEPLECEPDTPCAAQDAAPQGGLDANLLLTTMIGSVTTIVCTILATRKGRT